MKGAEQDCCPQPLKYLARDVASTIQQSRLLICMTLWEKEGGRGEGFRWKARWNRWKQKIKYKTPCMAEGYSQKG